MWGTHLLDLMYCVHPDSVWLSRIMGYAGTASDLQCTKSGEILACSHHLKAQAS